ncbi:MAG: peptide-methionine (S)-S-oxide reductase MsrA [Nibricoccus sp.]
MKAFFHVLFIAAAAFSMTPLATAKTENLVLGGGCFWCLDATFRLVPGVKNVVSGYAGGDVANPTYEQVCTGRTGHAEVVKIEYDPAQVPLEKLFDMFWTVHDPTTLNYQGNDHGTQYRSIILYANEDQKAAAEKAIAAAQKKFSEKIVTEVLPLKAFYPAEDYHQDYFAKNPTQGYCRYVVKPKVDKAKKALSAK